MAQKKRQHYVPQFYLKNFSSDAVHFSLINIQNRRLICDVPIKRQCYEPYFYQSREIEDRLGEMETSVAPIVEKAIRCETPCLSRDEQKALKTFAVFQFLRTGDQYEQLIKSKSAILSCISEYRIPQGIPRPIVEQYIKQKEGKRPLQEALEFSDRIVDMVEDLDLAIITFSKKHSLISSDNPVVLFNNYYKQSVGFAMAGLVIALPLSTNKLMLIYDSSMYAVNAAYGVNSESKYSDCLTLNVLQLYNAVKIAFSIDAIYLRKMKYKLEAARKARERKEACKIATIGPKENKLIIDQGPWPVIDTHLTFLSLRQEAREIPVIDRDFFERQYNPEGEQRLKKLRILTTHPKIMNLQTPPRDFRAHIKFVREYWGISKSD